MDIQHSSSYDLHLIATKTISTCYLYVLCGKIVHIFIICHFRNWDFFEENDRFCYREND